LIRQVGSMHYVAVYEKRADYQTESMVEDA